MKTEQKITITGLVIMILAISSWYGWNLYQFKSNESPEPGRTILPSYPATRKHQDHTIVINRKE